MPSQTAAERGEAELRILDFKTTWSEFQKPSQTASEQGKAELRIFDFKTTQSEFQKPSQTPGSMGVQISFRQKQIRDFVRAHSKPWFVWILLKNLKLPLFMKDQNEADIFLAINQSEASWLA